MTDVLKFDAPATGATFSVDPETRTIRGLAVPYGVAAKSGGRNWQFSKGTLTYSDLGRVKLLAGHDWTQAIGRAIEVDDTDDGLVMAFKVARGAEGDRALALAEDGVWDGLSIGTDEGIKASERDGVFHVSNASLLEVSLTPLPAFSDARVTSVAASSDITKEGTHMTDQVTTPADESVSLSAVTEAIKAGFAERPAVVTPSAQFEVSEPLPYRFDGIPGEHSLSLDMRASQQGDSEARQRVDGFLKAAFAVTTGNTATLNPTENRPELYVPSLEYTRPLWNMVTTGSVTDKTPFTIPKFASASNLVNPHTEGVEPTPGSFSATVQTVTPSAISGKIEINREVLDQGGSPQADAIIWREMLNGWFEALEARVASLLNGLSLTPINLGSAQDAALVDQVSNIFVDLQFERGGNRFSALALDDTLFKPLIGAADGDGRKLLPVVNPTNAQGSVSGNFAGVQIGSQTGVAAWALKTGNAATSNSYLFVPSSVYAWASAPTRFDFQYQVKSVDMAIWGYAATAVTRDSDVKRIKYSA